LKPWNFTYFRQTGQQAKTLCRVAVSMMPLAPGKKHISVSRNAAIFKNVQNICILISCSVQAHFFSMNWLSEPVSAGA